MEVAISNGFGIKHLRILNTFGNKGSSIKKFICIHDVAGKSAIYYLHHEGA